MLLLDFKPQIFPVVGKFPMTFGELGTGKMNIKIPFFPSTVATLVDPDRNLEKKLAFFKVEKCSKVRPLFTKALFGDHIDIFL